MPLPKTQTYTIDDIYTLPDGERAELIDGQMYMMAPPNRMHQELVQELSRTIGNYIKSKGGLCKVYPAMHECSVCELTFQSLSDTDFLKKHGNRTDHGQGTMTHNLESFLRCISVTFLIFKNHNLINTVSVFSHNKSMYRGRR